jgi:hypothetical protein
VMAHLAGGDALRDMLFVDKIAGFDMSSFNDFAPPVRPAVRSVDYDVLSDDTELLRFDFHQRNFPTQNVPKWLTATKSGLCVGIIQWIRIELDSETHYENRPGPEYDKTHWVALIRRFPRLVPVQPGDVVPIVVRHDRRRVLVDLAE